MGDRKAPTPPPGEPGYTGPANQVRPTPPPAPPRKWHVERNINDYGIVRGNEQIAGYIVSKTDARLMAAAPDLLAVTRKLLHAIKVLGYEPVDRNYTSIVEQAEMAIAKAEGRS